MSIKQMCILLIMFFVATSIHAGGVQPDFVSEIEDTESSEGADEYLDLNRLNPPVSAEEYKSYQLQTGVMDFLSAEERTYYITSGDLLIIKLPDEQQFSEYEVNFEGYITLPKLGNFKAEGLTIGELEKSIFYRLPIYLRQMGDVEVQIKQKKKYVQILGYVMQPGWYLLPDNVSVQGALSIAGGMIDGSILNEIQIYRTIYSLKSSEIKNVLVDMFQFQTTTDYKILPDLKSKDIVVVPMTPRIGTIKRSLAPLDPPREELETDTEDKIRVAGRVNNPSMFEPIKGSNLLDILISAGGTTADADIQHIFLVKKLKNGNYRTKIINLEQYIKNQNFQDIPYVGSGETIYVPEKRKTWLQKVWDGSIDFLKDFMYIVSALSLIHI